MDLIFLILDLVLHFDRYLPGIIQTYGIWTYLVLFAIIFCETGLVVTPYLPGDSLLFIAGALAGAGYLNIVFLVTALALAAVLGDSLNYWIGYTMEMRVLEKYPRFVRKQHLEETHEYFQRYGGFTIVIARFIPFVRTFAPFLAGVGKMRYPWFLSWNILGGALWICTFTFAGFFFGSIPVVRENFGLIVYAIIGISILAVLSIVVRIMQNSGQSGKTGQER